MKVKDVMKKKVIKIKQGTSYKEVIKILLTNKISGAPVVDNKDKLIGMVSEKDLFRILYPYYKSYYENPELYLDLEERESKAKEIQNHKVETFMSKEVVTTTPDAPAMAAGAIMLAKGIHRLVVVEKEKVVGIITRRDIYHPILKQSLYL